MTERSTESSEREDPTCLEKGRGSSDSRALMGTNVPGGALTLDDVVALQDTRHIEFMGELLSQMKLVLKRGFDEMAMDYRRNTGRAIRSYIPVIPGGPTPTVPPEERIRRETFDDLPQVSVGFQYRERMCPEFRDKFLGKGLFEVLGDRVPARELSSGCTIFGGLDEIRIFSCCPFVMVVDLANLSASGIKRIPTTWADLLDPVFEDSICINGTKYGPDLNILMYIERRFGERGLRALRENVAGVTHASRMCRYIGTKRNAGTVVYLMPAYFASICEGKARARVVWPEDGAAFQPIFLMGKLGSYEDLRVVYDYVLGKGLGRQLADNRFPVTNPEVDNSLEGRGLDWFGWDYVLDPHVGERISRASVLFESVPKL
jgi:hypothetical protein